ncbi:hypothetical protein KFK09_022642 [Dendrobium nobile]|uniref:Uncharacterized protein n=1 Tax=Dendrobium nobile TaxID=94219 RepID=A0A8T3AID8_DENNO|nr:hypothetical protein KFK09_022642 [Dendrobium nobile]
MALPANKEKVVQALYFFNSDLAFLTDFHCGSNCLCRCSGPVRIFNYSFLVVSSVVVFGMVMHIILWFWMFSSACRYCLAA